MKWNFIWRPNTITVPSISAYFRKNTSRINDESVCLWPGTTSVCRCRCSCIYIYVCMVGCVCLCVCVATTTMQRNGYSFIVAQLVLALLLALSEIKFIAVYFFFLLLYSFFFARAGCHYLICAAGATQLALVTRLWHGNTKAFSLAGSCKRHDGRLWPILILILILIQHMARTGSLKRLTGTQKLTKCRIKNATANAGQKSKPVGFGGGDAW